MVTDKRVQISLKRGIIIPITVLVLLSLATGAFAESDFELENDVPYLVVNKTMGDSREVVMWVNGDSPRKVAFTLFFSNLTGADWSSPWNKVNMVANDTVAMYRKDNKENYHYYETSSSDNYDDDKTEEVKSHEEVKTTLVYATNSSVTLRFNGNYFVDGGHFLTLNYPDVSTPFLLLPHSDEAVVIPVNDAFTGYTPQKTSTTYRIYLPWKYINQTYSKPPASYTLLVSINSIRGGFEVFYGSDIKAVKGNDVSVKVKSGGWNVINVTIPAKSDSYYLRVYSGDIDNGIAYRLFSQVYPSDRIYAKSILEPSTRKVTCLQESTSTFSCSWTDPKFVPTTYTLIAVPYNSSTDLTYSFDDIIFKNTQSYPELPDTIYQPNLAKEVPDTIIRSNINTTSIKIQPGKVNVTYKIAVFATLRNASAYAQPWIIRYDDPEPLKIIDMKGKTNKPTDTGSSGGGGGSFFTWVIILAVIAGAIWFYRKKQQDAANAAANNSNTQPLLQERATGGSNPAHN